MWSGMLKRVSSQSIPFKVILNDDPIELPAVHARGRLGEQDAEFWILDDPDNPLALKWRVGETQLQVIRLSYPMETQRETTPLGPPQPSGSAKLPAGTGGGGAGGGGGANAAAGTARRIEEDLVKEGRAIVYGIYFDFASDRIKEESEPVLAEIAQVMQQNAAWNLNVEGHTDSIGGDPYNLGLSQRRSAAVKQALVTRYKIDSTRLQTSGYGASRPKDRNDTIEGRARNRRVELVKAP
jgi:outer membrane protein OmpA-like peptidoglycan-associated protein